MATPNLPLHRPSAPASTPTLRRNAPGTRIGYDPLLIQRFQNDHQRMLRLFTEVQSLLTAGDYDGVQRKLGEFRVVLQDHLMTASVKFYVYMTHLLDGDAGKSALLNQQRREMLNNSRLIMDFLRTYSAARLDDSFAEAFQIELLSIGAALVQRIEREESALFPLYRAVR